MSEPSGRPGSGSGSGPGSGQGEPPPDPMAEWLAMAASGQGGRTVDRMAIVGLTAVILSILVLTTSSVLLAVRLLSANSKPSTPTQVAAVTDTATPAPTATATPSITPTGTPTATATPEPSGTPSPIVAKFMARITRSDFQFEGTVDVDVDLRGSLWERWNGAAGTMRVKGDDSDIDLSDLASGPYFWEFGRTICADGRLYFESSSSNWSPTTGSPNGRTSFVRAFAGMTGITDVRTIDWKQKKAHLLSVATLDIDPTLFGLGNSSVYSDVHTDVDFYALGDGTPAGMTIRVKWREMSQGELYQGSLLVDVTFDKLSGVTIQAPI